MKKIFTITLLVLLTVGLFVSCNADAVETVTALKCTLTSEKILVDSLGREYKNFVVSKTGETYKLIKILSKNEECLIKSDEKNIIVRTDGGKVTINAPKAVVEHFGTADSVIVKKVANDSYHCHAEVSKSLSIEAGHVVLNVAVPSVEIKATNDVSVEIVENIKVEQIKIEEPVSSVETPEIKISGIGEAKNIEVNTPVVIDMKVEQVEIKKAVEVEFSDSAEVSNVAVSVDKTEIDNLKITVGDNAKIKGVSVDDEIKEDIKNTFVDNSGQTQEVHQHSFKTELKNKNDKWYEVTTCTGVGCTYQSEKEIDAPSPEEMFSKMYPNAVCRIGDVGYDYPFNYTLNNKGYTDSAFSAAKDGDVIVMIKDFDLLTDISSSASDRSNDKTNGCKVTINLNGHSIKYKSQIQLTQGEYTFTDTSLTKEGKVDSTISLYGMQDESHIVKCYILGGSFKKIQTAGDKGAKYLTVSEGHIDYCEVQETEYNADAILSIGGGTFDYVGISTAYSDRISDHIQFTDGRKLSDEITDKTSKLSVYGSEFMANAYILFKVDSVQ